MRISVKTIAVNRLTVRALENADYIMGEMIKINSGRHLLGFLAQ